jgi:hypothetical protein
MEGVSRFGDGRLSIRAMIKIVGKGNNQEEAHEETSIPDSDSAWGRCKPVPF